MLDVGQGVPEVGGVRLGYRVVGSLDVGVWFPLCGPFAIRVQENKFWKEKICFGYPEIKGKQIRYLRNYSGTKRGD